MTVLVRAVRPEGGSDVEGFARVRRAVLPHMISDAAALAYDLSHAHPAAHFRLLVAEQDGEIIGAASVAVAYDSPKPGVGVTNVYVHPQRRGRGAGSLIVRAAEEHLAAHGARSVFSWVLDEPDYRAFAAGRGYRPRRAGHFLRLNLSGGALPPRPVPAAGVELATGEDFADDPRPLFHLDAETMADEPSDVDVEFSQYEQWLVDTWRHPLASPELTTVALVDGRPVAFTLARTDACGQYGTVMTGTSRAFRGRGLARLCKSESLHRARAAGYTIAFTSNDAANGAMLAINRWCGYAIAATEVRYVRELD